MTRHLLASVALLTIGTAAALPAQELSHDSGKADGKQSRAGSGHAIEFAAKKKAWVTAVRIHGARYGGGYDAGKTPFGVSICDDKMRELTHTEAMYSAFKSGRFEWVDVPLSEPVEVKGEFHVVVAFDPARTRGVYVSFCESKDKGHSGYGLPGGKMRPEAGKEWLIRAVLSKKKPKGAKSTKAGKAPNRRAVYQRDFDFLARTIQSGYPALKKKDIDWSGLKRQARKDFLAAADDAAHIRNVHLLLARLQDSHTTVTDSEVEVHVPAFDGLYGAGLWIASERGRLVLRGCVPDHPAQKELVLGAELVTIDGKPARLVREQVRSQLRQWYGWSSTNFLDARLSFQFFPFGEQQRLPAQFVNPDGKVVDVKLERWGPGGRGLSRQAVTMPEGAEAKGKAVAVMLDEQLGYVRILGSMNAATQEEFFAALDELRAARGIVLDCRGMGGGGDGPAWAMAGRFFTEPTANGTAPKLQPTGAWQFTGPVVMLQDEREISSAETFTWAMTETGRVVSVGRPTGGATIIPRGFSLPSGLAKFRMGVHDRKTPVRAVQPEGIGTAPDVWVPHDPWLLEKFGDSTLAVGKAVLRQLVAGAERAAVVDAFAGLLAGSADQLQRAGDVGRERLPTWLGSDYVAAAVEWETRLCGHRANALPDFAGAATRVFGLAAVAEALGAADLAKTARAAASSWQDEVEAQVAWQQLHDRGADKKAWQAFSKKFRGTRYGKAGG